VFEYDGSMWGELFKLTASDGAAGDWFGSTVSISGDVAFVGAKGNDTVAGVDAGSAYFFELVPPLTVSITDTVAAFSQTISVPVRVTDTTGQGVVAV